MEQNANGLKILSTNMKISDVFWHIHMVLDPTFTKNKKNEHNGCQVVTPFYSDLTPDSTWDTTRKSFDTYVKINPFHYINAISDKNA